MGIRCDQMSFLLEGTLAYTQYPQLNHPNPRATWSVENEEIDLERSGSSMIQIPVKEGEWFCEACLWTNWVHVGTMEAEEMSKVMEIDASKFMSLSKKHTRCHKSTSSYAKCFVKELN